MSCDVAIKIQDLSKHYQIYEQPSDRLRQIFSRGRKKFHKDFCAVQDVSFEVARGEVVGIVGKNGSGKSTLLQMICGTLNPTTGTVEVKGRVAALLELGAGFNPEFTGRENVYLSAALYGLSRQEIDARYDEIVAFSEIGEFIDQPVKTYSSGMFVRLAFAVIAHVDADVLVIDEALSVGDAYFVQKCMRFLREFMRRGTLLFCSHDTEAVLHLCTKAILMNRGRLELLAEPKKVVEKYLAAFYSTENSAQREENNGSEAPSAVAIDLGEYRDARLSVINQSALRNDIELFRFDEQQSSFGQGGARIVDVQLLDSVGRPLSWAVGGEDVQLCIRCEIFVTLNRPIVGFQFRDRLGQIIFADNTYLSYCDAPITAVANSELVALFSFRMPLLPSGDYSISPAIADGTQETHVQHHWVHDACIVRVHASSVCLGLVGVPMRAISLAVSS
ncbi:ABC transporter ATP-binding protein [Dyella koreensis]|uniref:ABC transporter ATP-binding protein n=1 Tax=Dyella koreensis TaxID=311235 RepID=A0ABW8K6D5_9GAMM